MHYLPCCTQENATFSPHIHETWESYFSPSLYIRPYPIDDTNNLSERVVDYVALSLFIEYSCPVMSTKRSNEYLANAFLGWSCSIYAKASFFVWLIRHDLGFFFVCISQTDTNVVFSLFCISQTAWSTQSAEITHQYSFVYLFLYTLYSMTNIISWNSPKQD